MNPLCLWKAAVLLGAVASCVHARVGEPQATIERRLLAPGVGKLLASAVSDEPRGGVRRDTKPETPRRRATEPPYRKFQHLFPDSVREQTYWKSALPHQLSADDGWEVHVVYLSDRSALEAYQRVGEGLNEFEVMALLAVNRGNSVWRRVEKTDAAKGALGYGYELEDGTLRARQQGNWLLIFSTRLDDYAGQRLAEERAFEALELERLKRVQQAKAPDSVAGF